MRRLNPNSIGFGTDRAAFASWRRAYWISRASDFAGGERMGMANMNAALQLTSDNEYLADFAGARTPDLVDSAERMLGVAFPPSYRRFLTGLGASSIAGEEFYGVIGDDVEHSGVPDAVWLTLRNRRELSRSTSLVIVYDLGDGTRYMLDMARYTEDGECPVVSFHGIPKQGETLELVAHDFGEFFLRVVSEALGEQDRQDRTLH